MSMEGSELLARFSSLSFRFDFQLGHSGSIPPMAKRAGLEMNPLPAETEIRSNNFALRDSRNRAPEQDALFAKQRTESFPGLPLEDSRANLV
jgi:hypothetical protein